MRVIDSHAHLSFDIFRRDLDSVIAKARKVGVVAVINPTITPKDFENALRIAERYKDYVFPALGLAPQILNEELFQKFLLALKNFEKSYIAVGECGLDFHWVRDEEKVNFMRESFREVLQIIEKLGKPIIIHARSAHHRNAYIEIVRELEVHKIKKAVFHAFLGSKKDIRMILNGDWLVSIPTVYVRRKDLWHIISSVPLERMLVETDSPYLAPRRGIRNEPANVIEVVKLIARINNMDEEDVAEILTKNTINLFELRIIGID